MNEIVKYHNDFGKKIILKKFTANELNFLMAICSKMKEQGDKEIEFSFEHLKKLSNWVRNDNNGFLESLKNTNKKLLELNFEMGNEEGGIIQFVLFPTFNILPKSKILKVAVNRSFSYLLNGLSSNFTRFELENFTFLQSKYSKILYKELMRFKSTGYMVISIEDFKEKLDIPKTYQMTHIKNKILRPIRKEFPSVFQKFSIAQKKKGRSISHFEFYFSLKKEERDYVYSSFLEKESDVLKDYWRENFPSVNYSLRHQEKIQKLLETMTENQILIYLKEQWEFVKNNPSIENGPAYFSSLILDEKAVLKDYEKQNRGEEISLTEDRIQAEHFVGSLFDMNSAEEAEKEEEDFHQQVLFSTEISQEEYDRKYKEYLEIGEVKDTATQRRIFKNIIGKQYKVLKKK